MGSGNNGFLYKKGGVAQNKGEREYFFFIRSRKNHKKQFTNGIFYVILYMANFGTKEILPKTVKNNIFNKEIHYD